MGPKRVSEMYHSPQRCTGKSMAWARQKSTQTPQSSHRMGSNANASLMASKRQLFVLPQLVSSLRAMIAEEKGEVTAEVASATALSAEQSERLANALSASAGKDVKIVATVDESLIGGLVVKIGSKMIDTSIRSKLMALQNIMKEVG